MKTLFLVRHSKAVTRKPDLPDFQRTLVRTGEKKSVSMAKKLKKEGVMPDLMISSTANRALETAHLFGKNLGYSNKNIEVKDALYNEMSPEALLYIVRQVNDKHKSIMLFGHNPAFTDFAAYLVKGFDEDIPKTGIVGIQFQEEKWMGITKGSGKLEFFEYPRRLSKAYKRLESELRVEIALKIQEVLDKADLKSAKKMKKAVKKSSNRIANEFLKKLKAERAKEKLKALSAEKTKKKKAEPKAKKKSKAEPKPKTEHKVGAKPEPKKKSVAEPKTKAKSKSVTRAKPKQKLGSEPASKPKVKETGTTKAAAPKAARLSADRKLAPKPKVNSTRKTTPGTQSSARRTKKRG